MKKTPIQLCLLALLLYGSIAQADHMIEFSPNKGQIVMVLKDKVREVSKGKVTYQKWHGLLIEKGQERETEFTIWHHGHRSQCAISSRWYVMDLRGTEETCNKIKKLTKEHGPIALMANLAQQQIKLVGKYHGTPAPVPFDSSTPEPVAQ